MLKIENTGNQIRPTNLVMIIYGKPGVGKTTLAATFPKPLLLDFEGGTRFLGMNGIAVDVLPVTSWFTKDEKIELNKLIKDYQTIIIDPLSEAMDMIIHDEKITGKKYRSDDGSLTLAGWGLVKDVMRQFIKWLRGSGKHVLMLAHVEEIKDGENLLSRILVPTKLREEIPNMVDFISYYGVSLKDGDPKRILYTPKQGNLFDSKQRGDFFPLKIEIPKSNGYEALMAAINQSFEKKEDCTQLDYDAEKGFSNAGK